MPIINGFFRGLGCGLLWMGVLVAPRPSWAAEPSVAVGRLNATKDQPRLEVRRVGATLQAVACPGTCDWNAATSWTLEAPFADAAATFTALEIGEGRRAAHVVVSAAERRYELVLAAPVRPTAKATAPAAPLTTPFVAFAGETGLSVGEAPDRTGALVEVLPTTSPNVNVVVGNIQEDVSLCGRRALLSPRLLHPQTLSLKAIKLQRLTNAERDAATKLSVAPLGNQIASNIFTPLVASSAKGSPAALVDNDPQTVWTENRGGSGGGEFVVFRAPESIGITGLTFAAPGRPKPEFRPPTAFWVATTDKVYRVELPTTESSAAVNPAPPTDVKAVHVPDPALSPRAPSFGPAANAPMPAAPRPTSASDGSAPLTNSAPSGTTPEAIGAPGHPTSIAQSPVATPAEVEASRPVATTPREWYVPLPAPIQTSCLAISLDTAAQNDGDLDVGLAEIGATTNVDEARLNQALAELDSGGDQATAAEQLLQDVGRVAFERVQTRYRGYSEAGRMRALNVMDAAPCRYSVGVYASALSNEGSAEAEHGQAGLTRCRGQAVPALARRLPESASERTRLLVSMLLRLDPVAAVDAMAPLLAGGSRAKRRVLQLAFSAAVVNPEAAVRAKALLSDAKLTVRDSLFLMRALGSHLIDYADVAAPRLAQALPHADFATQYLALSPAAVLAPKQPELQRFLLDTLAHAKQPALRVEAARVLHENADADAALVRAIGDEHVRVREAAVVSAGEHVVEVARPALHERLERDEWPFVRSAAVRALGLLPANPETQARLADAVEHDDAPSVRRPALHVLGIHDARAQLPVVRQAFAHDQDVDVRATAATSLGLMCDRTMIDDLTKSALKFGNLYSSEGERVVGKASLNALGRLAPPDLKQRLKPFFAEGAPQIAKYAAEAALDHPEKCGRTPPKPIAQR